MSNRRYLLKMVIKGLIEKKPCMDDWGLKPDLFTTTKATSRWLNGHIAIDGSPF